MSTFATKWEKLPIGARNIDQPPGVKIGGCPKDVFCCLSFESPLIVHSFMFPFAGKTRQMIDWGTMLPPVGKMKFGNHSSILSFAGTRTIYEVGGQADCR